MFLLFRSTEQKLEERLKLSAEMVADRGPIDVRRVEKIVFYNSYGGGT